MSRIHNESNTQRKYSQEKKLIDCQFEKTGDLHKLGFSSGKWQKRKIRCSGGVIRYFEKSFAGLERGLIPLVGAEIVDLPKGSTFSSDMTGSKVLFGQLIGREHCFALKSVDVGNSSPISDLVSTSHHLSHLDCKERMYLFSAKTEELKQEWMRVIRGAMSRAGDALLSGSVTSESVLVNVSAVNHAANKMQTEMNAQATTTIQQTLALQQQGAQMQAARLDQHSAAVGLIIKLGPGRCGFVVMDVLPGIAVNCGIQKLRDVIIGYEGTRLTPFPNNPAALQAYNEARSSAFRTRGKFTLLLCDTFTLEEREVTVESSDPNSLLGLAMNYQDNVPGSPNDCYVAVWKPLVPGGTAVGAAGFVRYLELPSVSNQDLFVETWELSGNMYISAGQVPFFAYSGAPPTWNKVELHRSMAGNLMMSAGERMVLPTRF